VITPASHEIGNCFLSIYWENTELGYIIRIGLWFAVCLPVSIKVSTCERISEILPKNKESGISIATLSVVENHTGVGTDLRQDLGHRQCLGHSANMGELTSLNRRYLPIVVSAYCSFPVTTRRTGLCDRPEMDYRMNELPLMHTKARL